MYFNSVSGIRFNPFLPRNIPLVGLLIAYTASVIGNIIASITLPWFILELTNDAASAGIAAFVNTVPLVIGTLFGGVYVDRVERRQVSIIADAVSSLSIAAILILYTFADIQFWQVLVFAFIGALLDASSVTARESLLPEVARLARVPLLRVNTVTEMIQGLSLLVGPAIASFLIATIGAVNTLGLNATLLLVAVTASIVLLPKRLGRAAANSQENYLASLKEGLRFVASDRTIRTLITLFSLLTLAVFPFISVILPIFVQQKYGNAINLGFLISANGIGGIVGSTVYGTIGQRLSQRWMLIVSSAASSFMFIAFAFASQFSWILAASAIGGFFSAPFNPIVNTVVQQRTPTELQGRILGTVNGVSLIAAPAGLLIASLLLQSFGVQMAIAAIAVGLALIAVWILLNPVFQNLEKQ